MATRPIGDNQAAEVYGPALGNRPTALHEVQQRAIAVSGLRRNYFNMQHNAEFCAKFIPEPRQMFAMYG